MLTSGDDSANIYEHSRERRGRKAERAEGSGVRGCGTNLEN